MTCIVAYADQSGRITMGADSAGVDAWYSHQTRRDPKIYLVEGRMLIGFTTSFRMGQLLGYQLGLPAHAPFEDDAALQRWMVTEFIAAVRKCLEVGGWAEKKDNREHGGDFIVAYHRQLFVVQSDFQVAQLHTPFAAVGCGADLALGAMYATELTTHSLTVTERIRLALSTAEAFSSGVRSPFQIETLP